MRAGGSRNRARRNVPAKSMLRKVHRIGNEVRNIGKLTFAPGVRLSSRNA
jgi:hypothetical protein